MSVGDKNLFLVLKSEWYDMIESGRKKEEYREIKPYWIKRLVWAHAPFTDNEEMNRYISYLKTVKFTDKENEMLRDFCAEFGWFETITFQKGYSKNRMTFKFQYITIGEPKYEWSGGMKGNHFIIKIGERLENNFKEISGQAN